MAHAQQSSTNTPAAASSSASVASQIHAPAPHVTTKTSPVAAKTHGEPTKTRENYTLSPSAHRLDSYQNAVTPPPVATDR